MYKGINQSFYFLKKLNYCTLLLVSYLEPVKIRLHRSLHGFKSLEWTRAQFILIFAGRERKRLLGS